MEYTTGKREMLLDKIAALTAERDRYREALKVYADSANWRDYVSYEYEADEIVWDREPLKGPELARKALEGEK